MDIFNVEEKLKKDGQILVGVLPGGIVGPTWCV